MAFCITSTMLRRPVITVFPIPAPAIVIDFETTISDDHVALPAVTLTVAPVAAFAMHWATLARSGVVVQFGFEPVHAAEADEIPHGASATAASIAI